ncbi:YbaK/prolyl-tRNA synthetase associated protein [Rhodobacterales bacterium HTCC2150]|nr:YbaK/prolyl-tRNA synthetase associated protein [Rhodobacterales bacterium HTCC2150] [Rhodobacteraceae bacterium HTCC2150]
MIPWAHNGQVIVEAYKKCFFTENTKDVGMGKSLNRVKAALIAATGKADILAMEQPTRTAQLAADAVECEVDQIAKSILFQGQTSGDLYLFVTAGANEVHPAKATELAGEVLDKADANTIRKVTGFAIGGISPVGHLTQPRAYFDTRLTEFDIVWAAAGTPNHVFSSTPTQLLALSGAKMADFTK